MAPTRTSKPTPPARTAPVTPCPESTPVAPRDPERASDRPPGRWRQARTQAGMAAAFLAPGRRFRPFKITAVLTERCHLRCEFCNLWKEPDDGARTDEWIEFFRRNRGFRWIDLTGGEIFARPKLDRILESLLDFQPRLALLAFPTAGQIPAKIEGTVQKLIASRLSRLGVTVSIDGGPALHDRIRGVEGAFERAIDTYSRLRVLRSKRFSVQVGCTLTEEAPEQYESLRDALKQRFADFDDRELHFNLAHTSGHYYHNEDYDSLPGDPALDIVETTKRRQGLSAWIEWIYGSLARRGLAENFPPMGCEAIRKTLFIRPDLSVYPCSIWDRSLGNLRDHDLDLSQLLRTAAVAEAREVVDARACPGCFTPCEAVPAILSHPLTASVLAYREHRRIRRSS